MVYSTVDCEEAGRDFLAVLFFVTSDFYFSVFRTACFSGREKRRPEKHVSVCRLNYCRDETKQTAIETTYLKDVEGNHGGCN